jgi:hypothetical protein
VLHACCTVNHRSNTAAAAAAAAAATAAARNAGINNYRCITIRDVMKITRFRVAVDSAIRRRSRTYDELT